MPKGYRRDGSPSGRGAPRLDGRPPLPVGEFYHGDGAYSNHGCRCDVCKKSWAARIKKQYYNPRCTQKSHASSRQKAYRARKKGAKGNASYIQIQARVEMWGGKCYLCGNMYEAIDHVIPLSKGGTHWPANLRPICKSCNSSKGATTYLQ